MANPVCDVTTLLNFAGEYDLQQLSPFQQRVLELFGMVLELKAIGGTDYTGSALTTTLVQDAATLFNGFTTDQLEAARINLSFIRAQAAGATVPGGVNQIGVVDANAQLSALGNLIFADDLTIEKMRTLLTCKLGVHKNYPQ